MEPRVLLLDSSQHYPANPLFAEALADLRAERGFGCVYVDESRYLKKSNRHLGRISSRLSRAPVSVSALNRDLMRRAETGEVNVALIVKGPFVRRETVAGLRKRGVVLLNFATDDPFNMSASTEWMRQSLPEYDIYFSTKRAVIGDLTSAGCRRVEYMPFAYKPQVHFYEGSNTPEEVRRFECDVSFVGGADDVRAAFFQRLLNAEPQLKLKLYGGYWERYRSLRAFHCGAAVGRAFRLAASGAAVCVNLVRRANRDGHVMRSFELPACGAFVAAERTAEHTELFREGREMVCFDGEEEFVEVMRRYLRQPEERRRIAAAGQAAVRQGGNTYKDRLLTMLERAGFEVG